MKWGGGDSGAKPATALMIRIDWGQEALWIGCIAEYDLGCCFWATRNLLICSSKSKPGWSNVFVPRRLPAKPISQV
jgi:hypothetical protein